MGDLCVAESETKIVYDEVECVTSSKRNTSDKIDIRPNEMETWTKWKLINPFAWVPMEVPSVFAYKNPVYFVCFYSVFLPQ